MNTAKQSEAEVSGLLEAALAYAAAGIPVFPCKGNKSPLVRNGFHDATTDAAVIRERWSRWPDALIGIPTGRASGVAVLDLDIKNGKDGLAAIPEWKRMSPVKVRTRSGGVHLYFKAEGAPRNTSDKIALGVDTRGEGGYVIAPGSPGYRWIGESRDLSNLPPWPEAHRPTNERSRASTESRPRGKLFRPRSDHAKLRLGRNEPPAWLGDLNHGGLGISTDPGDLPRKVIIEELAAMIAVIPNADLGWDDYNRILMALFAATQGSEEGRMLAHRFASKSKKYHQADTNSRWDHYFRSPPDQLSAGTLFHLADEADPSWRDAFQSDQDDTSASGAPADVDWPTPFEWIDPKSIPRRRWLYPLYYVRKFLSLTISTGGVGKSSLAIVEALAMASGKPLLGPRPEQKLRVWYWNGEDPFDELQRRVIAAATHFKLDWQDDVGDRLAVNSGRQLEIIVAEDHRFRALVNKKIVDEMVERIRSKQIDVVIIDPFVSSHRVSENDNSAIELVAKTWARIADEADCAVMLVHHSRKTGGDGATVEDGRGASALLNAARSARSLNTMTSNEAKNASIEERDRRLHFRSDLGKANMSRPAEVADWYKLDSVDLENHGADADWDQGDKVGVVTRWAYPRVERPRMTIDDIGRAQEIIKAGGPWRLDQRAKKESWIGRPIAETLGLDLGTKANWRVVATIVNDWLASGFLRKREKPDKKGTLRSYVEVGELPSAVKTIGGGRP